MVQRGKGIEQGVIAVWTTDLSARILVFYLGYGGSASRDRERLHLFGELVIELMAAVEIGFPKIRTIILVPDLSHQVRNSQIQSRSQAL